MSETIYNEYHGVSAYDTSEILLRYCPFCGGMPYLLHYGNDHTKKRRVVIKCVGCQAEQSTGGIRQGFSQLEGHAALKWNQRSDREQD